MVRRWGLTHCCAYLVVQATLSSQRVWLGDSNMNIHYSRRLLLARWKFSCCKPPFILFLFASTFISCPLYCVSNCTSHNGNQKIKNLLVILSTRHSLHQIKSAMFNSAGVKAPHYSSYWCCMAACRVMAPLLCTYNAWSKGWIKFHLGSSPHGIWFQDWWLYSPCPAE